jgi:hypothetical protein
MTDLTDRAALREQFDAGQNEYEPGEDEPGRVNVLYSGDEVLAIIDAAPTASCEECEYGDGCLRDIMLDKECNGEWESIDLTACSHFERRQP